MLKFGLLNTIPGLGAVQPGPVLSPDLQLVLFSLLKPDTASVFIAIVGVKNYPALTISILCTQALYNVHAYQQLVFLAA